jgi:hypothetical protein
MANELRVKFGYLYYDEIPTRIENGDIDVNDIIFTRDTHETLIISEDLSLVPMRSKVYVFNSVSDANTALNTNTDTYKGQIISILNNDKYSAYIVNQDPNGVYFTTALSAENIDYNTLGNRPIENLVGTLDSPIMISNLDIGMYKVKGQYKISATDITTYLSTDGDLFIIGESDTGKIIKRFTKDTIQDYVISDNGIEKTTYVTDKYLLDNGYSTTTYVDSKLSAFEETIRQDIQTYVEQTVEQVIEQKVDAIIDERLDAKLDERIKGSTDEEVQNFFT